MGGNAVSYAEETLEVQKAFTYLQDHLDHHETAGERAAAARKAIRALEFEIEQAEVQIVSDTWAAHSGEGFEKVSGAEKERLSKRAIAEDPNIKRLKQDLIEQQDEQDEAKTTEAHYALRCRGLTARLEELGGLLNFYAAAKLGAPTVSIEARPVVVPPG